MPVYFILIRRQESSPGLWCCRGWAGGRLQGWGRPLWPGRECCTGWRECSTQVPWILPSELQRTIPADKDTICWLDCHDWPGTQASIQRSWPSKKLLFFLDGVDELRLLCEEHTEDLLRWGRALADAPPPEQMVWPHSHCPDHHNPLHAFSLMYSAQVSRWPQDLRGPCCLAAQRIWEQEILCNKFQTHELDLPFPECKYEVFQKDDDFENCSFIHLNIRGLGNCFLLSGNKQE